MNCEWAKFCVAQLQFITICGGLGSFADWETQKYLLVFHSMSHIAHGSHTGGRTPLFIADIWWTVLLDVRSHSPNCGNEKRWWEFITFHPSIHLKTYRVTEWERERHTLSRNSCPTLWPSVTFTHNGFIYRREADYSWCNILLAGAETPECWTRVSKGSECPGRALTRRLH